MDGCGAVSDCRRCPALVESRSQIVNGVGDPNAPLMLVGEAPGRHEDAEGEPFVGRSGDVLTETFETYGVDRLSIRITNCIRCRPPDNRDPRVGELSNCRSHLDGEVRAVDPAVVCPLGKVPAEHLLDREVAVTKEAGTVASAPLGGRERPIVICPHPAATLYDRSQRDGFDAALGIALSRAGLIADEDC